MPTSDLSPEERNWLKNITTTYKRLFWEKILINRRKENQGMELPPDVEAGRRWNDMIHNIEEIKQDVKKSGSILKTLANSAKQFVKDLRE